VLRYFQNSSSRDVGAGLGVDESVAQKRVARNGKTSLHFCQTRNRFNDELEATS
jgi:hypothetical protein